MKFIAKKRLHEYESGDIIPSNNFTMCFNQDHLLELGLIEKVDPFIEQYKKLVKVAADGCDTDESFDSPSAVCINGIYLDVCRFSNDVLKELEKRRLNNDK